MTCLPQHQAKQGFYIQALESIEPTSPSIEHTPVPDQAESEHCEGGNQMALAESIAMGELMVGRIEQLLAFLLEIPLLRG